MNRRMRKAVQSLYHHKATISSVQNVKEGSITRQKPVTIFSSIPCRVSLRSQKATEQGAAAQVEYEAKLYLSPDLDVPVGSEIVVTDINGRTTTYTGGKSFGYASHQEIYLKFKDKVR